LLLAEDSTSGELIGSCGMNVQQLTSKGARSSKGNEALMERPFMSNLAVAREYRKRGIASQLCQGVESEAKSWGYTEVLLKVEKDNRRAQRLYRRLGYRVVGIDKAAEKPEAGPSGLRFVPTSQVVMRKDLRFPPLDTVALMLLLGASLVLAYQSYEPLLSEVGRLAALGQFDEAAVQLVAAARVVASDVLAAANPP